MKISHCIEAAAYAYAIPVKALKARAKARVIAWPRFAAMWLARTQGFTTTQIARTLGMDHSTVVHGCRRVAELHDADEDFGDRLQRAWDSLTARHGGG